MLDTNLHYQRVA